MNLWAQVVDLKFDVKWGEESQDIDADFRRIDGGGRVVAWSGLPCPWRGHIQQRYDTSEKWALVFNPRSGMPLPNVVAHEIGHALGLGHGPSNNIMHASIQSHMTGLGSWDREEILRRYKPAKPSEPGEPEMGKFFECLVGVLPQLLGCLFKAEAESRAEGEEGPVSWAVKELEKQITKR